MEENKITLTFDDGSSQEGTILFTFPSKDNKENYVALEIEIEGEEEPAVVVMKYLEEEDGGIGELEDIPEEDTKAWDYIDEVLGAYFSDEECTCEECCG